MRLWPSWLCTNLYTDILSINNVENHKWGMKSVSTDRLFIDVFDSVKVVLAFIYLLMFLLDMKKNFPSAYFIQMYLTG